MENAVKQFGEVADIIDYLNEQLPVNQIQSLDISRTAVTRAFVSPLLDDPTAMMVVSKLVRLRTNREIVDFLRCEELMSHSLSFYKFFVLCGVRGEVTIENFTAYVLERKEQVFIQHVAMHKDFPAEVKNCFYHYYGDVNYLPQEAQDIFIF